jgi:peroxiredoxin
MIRPLLSEGDIAPDCILPDANGNEINLRSDSIAGNPIVIVFCPRLSAAGKDLIECFSEQVDTLSAKGARLFAITMDKSETASSLALASGFPILLDRREQVFASFSAPRDRPSTIVLRRNHHVAGILNGDPKAHIERTLLLLEGMVGNAKPI